MRIIFLDIDGVLNSTKTRETNTRNYGRASLANLPDHHHFDILNAIIRITDAKVVLSSSWKDLNLLTVLDMLFTVQGFQGELIGTTAMPSKLTRSGRPWSVEEEILHYLKECITKSIVIGGYVILDDVVINDFILKPHQVLIEDGLRDKHIAPAVDILNKPI